MDFIKQKAVRRFVRVSTVMLAAAFAVLSSRYLMAQPPATGAGETLYKSKCAGCHGPDGSGQTSMGKMMKLGDLRAPAVQKKTDAELAEIVTTGKSPMPAYGKQLSKEQIQEVVAYLRELAKKR